MELIHSVYNFLTTSWTVPAAVVVFVAQKFFVPQILELRELLKRAKYDVIYYANVFPILENKTLLNEKSLNDASKELRVIAAKLRASRDDIPFI